jgi:uncharacterized protein
MTRLRIDVADLLAHPGTRREVAVSDELEGLAGTSATIVGPVTVAATLERIPEGILVRGDVGGRWRADCSICLREIERDQSVHVDELFESDPVEGETYPLEGHEIDLEQLARDSLLLELPLAPHCEEACEPTRLVDAASDVSSGGGRPGHPPPALPVGEQRDDNDPRWAALAELEL